MNPGEDMGIGQGQGLCRPAFAHMHGLTPFPCMPNARRHGGELASLPCTPMLAHSQLPVLLKYTCPFSYFKMSSPIPFDSP
jgi:hypothetical protein